MSVFNVIKPTASKVPFILSIPHSGTKIPNDKIDFFNKNQINKMDDTDWFLDKLYDFAPKLGVTTVVANYHRWVIDLNRDPKNTPLYDDGRIITSICSTTNFNGDGIYNKNYNLTKTEISSRINTYFTPYHNYLKNLIADFLKEYPIVIIWDGHSIKRYVPKINENKFPDLIIGNNDNKSCNKRITQITLQNLQKSKYQVNLNTPFKGGYITRSLGNPENGVNSIQLEMSKDLYMSENEKKYDEKKALNIKSVIESTFEKLIEKL